MFADVLERPEPAWNTTSHVIQAGKTYTLRADVSDWWGDFGGMRISLYYEDAGRTIIVSEDTAFDGSFWQTTAEATFLSDDFPAAIGNLLGVQIGPSLGTYDGVDNIRLAFDPPDATPIPTEIPEAGASDWMMY